MAGFILKILTLVASGCAALLCSLVVAQLWKGRLAHRVNNQERRIIIDSDLAGIKIPSRFSTMLALICPLARYSLRYLRKRRLARIDDQLPDALALLGNALRAGLSLSQAIEMASLDLADPIRYEFARAVSNLKLGQTMEEALSSFGERLPTDDIALFVQSVEVLRRTGGNLVETFNAIARAIEGRRKVSGRIRVLTMQGFIQGIILLAMPWGMALMLHLVAPDYTEPLLSTRIGNAFIALGIALEAIGALWLKRIVVIRV